MRSYARNFILCNGTSAFLYWWNRSVTLVRTKFSFSAMTEAPSCIGEMIQQCVYAVQVLCNNNSTVEFKQRRKTIVNIQAAAGEKTSILVEIFIKKHTQKLYKKRFCRQPAAGEHFLGSFPPQDPDPWGGKLYSPPRIRTPGGGMKKPFPPHVGGGNKHPCSEDSVAVHTAEEHG